jgi:hypothetical protein
MADRQFIPLPALATELKRFGIDPPPYRYLHKAAMDCRIPATRSETGRWYVNRKDLPEIAKIMGVGFALAVSDDPIVRKHAN